MSEEPEVQSRPAGSERRKIAILGGGLSAMTTAYQLTHPDNPNRDDYEITLYQIGWRLGGKGASGRNQDPCYHQRIEEHGVHIFFGFYDNTFELMRDCYEELGRPAGAPLSRAIDPQATENCGELYERNASMAFQPQYFLSLKQHFKGQWVDWSLVVPCNDHLPGEPGIFETPEDYIHEVVALFHELFKGRPKRLDAVLRDHSHELEADLGFWGRALHSLLEALGDTGDDLAEGLLRALTLLSHWAHEGSEELEDLLEKVDGGLLGNLAKGLHEAVGRGEDVLSRWALAMVTETLGTVLRWLWPHVEKEVENDLEICRFWMALNYIYGNLHGALRDDLFDDGFDSINDRDYVEWLESAVVPDGGVTTGSPLVRWLYDALFAYEAGDLDRPRLEAGSALRALVRVMFTYKGSLAWRMTAGMGDVIFGPLYEVLSRRGVRFEFFHKATALRLSEDKTRVSRIELVRQAELKPGIERYQPLVEVEGLPCWPSTPLYDQLADGAELEKSGLNLEAYQAEWRPTEVVLEQGVHFDSVVLGVSIGALPCLCAELLDESFRWRRAVRQVGTVRTQAFQLWVMKSLRELGWPYDYTPTPLTGYDVESIDSYSDMTQVLNREPWPDGDRSPKSIAYFCGVQEECGDDPASCEPRPRLDRVKAEALEMVEKHLGALWPDAVGPDGFDWRLLVDERDDPGFGEERFDAQYWVSIVNPSDRYVLTLPDSSRHRLPAHDPAFSNLYLTGDWIQNTFNLGCAESAAMSGLATATAIDGYPGLDAIAGYGFGCGSEDDES